MFYYTRKNQDLNSSALDRVYFNENTGDLCAVTSSGQAYAYHGVTTTDFMTLTNASSVGRFYAKVIKPAYGPGERIDSSPANFVRVAAATVVTHEPTTPKNLWYSTRDATLEVLRLKDIVEREALVYFVLGNEAEPRVFKTKVFDDYMKAVEALEEVMSMLDIDFEVLQVVISFD